MVSSLPPNVPRRAACLAVSVLPRCNCLLKLRSRAACLNDSPAGQRQGGMDRDEPRQCGVPAHGAPPIVGSVDLEGWLHSILCAWHCQSARTE
jgi:hypothetical protein